MSKLYNKIEPLYTFNEKARTFNHGMFRNEAVRLLQYNKWIFTEKIDGMNFRIIWDGYNLTYGGRTDKAQFSAVQVDYIEKYLVTEGHTLMFEEAFGAKPVTVFGELFGAGIQKGGGLYTKDLDTPFGFRVFDVYVNDDYVAMSTAMSIASVLGYGFVPIVDLAPSTLQDGLRYVSYNTKSAVCDGAPFEGLVGRPVGEFRDVYGKRILVKIKCRDLGLSGDWKEGRSEQ